MKALRRNLGLGELYDVDYTMVMHDMAVTDIRVLFQELREKKLDAQLKAIGGSIAPKELLDWTVMCATR